MSDRSARARPFASLRGRRGWAIAVVALGLLFATPALASADPGDVGFEGHSGPGGAPSGSKPESKLWFNDGRWWGSLFDVATGDSYIWVLDQTTDTWSRTATRIDDRSGTRGDVLWDGTKLYVASHNFSESDGSGQSRLYRYSYDTGSDTYSLDSGFPATINSIKTETLVIAKDSTGQLWATWEAGGQIWVNRTTGSDSAWGTPFALPGAASVDGDDISSIIAFGGDKVGVFWSDQSTPDADYFAIHRDTDADTTWQPIETAYAGTNLADDHLNLKADSAGRVYSVVKTSLDNAGASPLIVLLVRQPNGTWSDHAVSASSVNQTRPIVVIDEVNSVLRVYATSHGSGGTINQHISAISPVSFPGGAGTVVLKDASSLDMNNVTTFKGNATASTGLIILAYEDTPRHYWHADILAGGGPPPNSPPSATATSATTGAGQAVAVALSGSDAETCQLTFSIVSGPSHGALGSIANAGCSAGSPNTDTASVTYTPAGGYSGPDSFTYRVNDGTTNSTTATASLTVTAGPDTTAPVRGSMVVFGATLEIGYDEPLDTGSVPAGSAYAVSVNGNSRGVSNVAISGTGVTLTLASPVVAGDGVTLGYTPGGSPIQDIAGNDAAAFSGVAVANQTQPPGGGTQTFEPTADAQVRVAAAATNYGTLATIRTGGEGTTNTYRSYLRFDVSGLTGPVTGVTLRLHATDASPNIVHVFPVANTTWIESGANSITWNSAPPMGGTELGSAAVPTLGGYNEITLSPAAVGGNGLVSFGLTIDGSNSAIFSSAEGADPPQLIITQG